MLNKDFLFELGVEEIPASFIQPAMEKIKAGLIQQCESLHLEHQSVHTYCTPRRFAVVVEQLQTRQDDEVIEKTGPAVRVAYQEDGTLSQAGQGFIRSCNATTDDAFVTSTPKGDYIAVRVEKKGRDTVAILPEILQAVISGLQFPKQMRWGALETPFARAVRWLVVLFGDEVVPFSAFQLQSGRITYGNRFRSIRHEVTIPNPTAYESVLEQAEVIPDREKRKQRIREQFTTMFAHQEDHVIPDDKLLETVVDLVEYPTAVMASFDAKYLVLPEKIITSTISENQKYFAVESPEGVLRNRFVFISNGDPAYSDLIRVGNEKVIVPRLEDAQFYFNEDLKQPLEDYVPRLKDVTFHAKLGSLYDKVMRVVQMGQYICKTLHVSEQEMQQVARTILLAKADLVTLMLGEKEFTKLQGYIGMKYALLQGESQAVAQGIFEHYLPRGQNDGLPETFCGAVAAIADKMDTVCGIIGIGQYPTGSNDPFALRRAANGVVQIIDQNNWNLNLRELILYGFELLKDHVTEAGKHIDFTTEYFRQRMVWLLQQSDIAYDIIDSIIGIHDSTYPELKQRALDIQSFRQRPDFIRLVIGFKRVSNILGTGTSFTRYDSSLCQEEAEQNLHTHYLQLENELNALLGRNDFHGMMESLVQYGKHIDRFFDEVLVNTEDEVQRKNRQSLLQAIRTLFLNVCDLTKIVVEGE